MKSISKLGYIFSGYLGIIASVCSVLSIVILAFQSLVSTVIALCALVLFLTILLIRILRLFEATLLKRYPQGYSRQSTFVKYSTGDANHIKYEVYKHIQCKTLIMDKFTYGFKWSGSKKPTIESHMQRNAQMYLSSKNGEYDGLSLNFISPLRYNECGVVHILMNIDDTDHTSLTHLSAKVEENIDLIWMKVELRYKPIDYNKNAILYKKLLVSDLPQEYKKFDEVFFDTVSKSYEYHLKTPEPGYIYKLEWIR